MNASVAKVGKVLVASLRMGQKKGSTSNQSTSAISGLDFPVYADGILLLYDVLGLSDAKPAGTLKNSNARQSAIETLVSLLLENYPMNEC